MSRHLPESLQSLLTQAGHDYIPLSRVSANYASSAGGLLHSHWLEVSQEEDAEEALKIFQNINFDWVVIDHYALNEVWESRVRRYCNRIMVIDDLADRNHICDILLDQNVGREASHYNSLVSSNALKLIGPRYAILRPEFAICRTDSLARRRSDTRIKKILITLGGVDQDNVTCDILNVFLHGAFREDLEIIVVMGSEAPWLSQVKECASKLKQSVTVLAGVKDMAILMKYCDLSIGAAGVTALERCCLGVPSLVLVLAENQISVANELVKSGAGILIENMLHLKLILNDILVANDKKSLLLNLINSSSLIVDGHGASRICDYLKH